MTRRAAHSSSPTQLDGARRAVHHLAASRPSASSCVHMLREVAAGHPGAVPRHRPSFRRRPTPIATRWRERWELNLVNAARGRAVARPVADEHRRRAARATRSGRCSRRSKTTTSGSPALRREQSPTRANLAEVEPFRCRSGKSLRKVSPLATWTTQGRLGLREGARHPAAAALRPATRASAASRARRCRSIRPTPRSGRWQGQKLECGIHIQPVGMLVESDAESQAIVRRRRCTATTNDLTVDSSCVSQCVAGATWPTMPDFVRTSSGESPRSSPTTARRPPRRAA